MHPLIRLAAHRPQVLATYASAYADLLQDDFRDTAALLRWRQVLTILAVGAGLCSGLWLTQGLGAMGLVNLPPPLANWGPLVPPLALAAVAWWAYRARCALDTEHLLPVLRQQWLADQTILNEVAAQAPVRPRTDTM